MSMTANPNPITPHDLQAFRRDLLKELIRILGQGQSAPAPKWLKSHDVQRLLRIAPSTLQTMRDKGILPYTKIGNVIYYDPEDVRKMLDRKTEPREQACKKLNVNHTRL